MTTNEIKNEMNTTVNGGRNGKPANDVTELVFILDRSGSMSGLESDTVGGFVIEQMERFPKAGESLKLGELRMKVLEADGLRVEKVLVQTGKKTEE